MVFYIAYKYVCVRASGEGRDEGNISLVLGVETDGVGNPLQAALERYNLTPEKGCYVLRTTEIPASLQAGGAVQAGVVTGTDIPVYAGTGITGALTTNVMQEMIYAAGTDGGHLSSSLKPDGRTAWEMTDRNGVRVTEDYRPGLWESFAQSVANIYNKETTFGEGDPEVYDPNRTLPPLQTSALVPSIVAAITAALPPVVGGRTLRVREDGRVLGQAVPGAVPDAVPDARNGNGNGGFQFDQNTLLLLGGLAMAGAGAYLLLKRPGARKVL